LEASALGSLIAACPAWKRREKRDYVAIVTLAYIDSCVKYSVS